MDYACDKLGTWKHRSDVSTDSALGDLITSRERNLNSDDTTERGSGPGVPLDVTLSKTL